MKTQASRGLSSRSRGNSLFPRILLTISLPQFSLIDDIVAVADEVTSKYGVLVERSSTAAAPTPTRSPPSPPPMRSNFFAATGDRLLNNPELHIQPA